MIESGSVRFDLAALGELVIDLMPLPYGDGLAFVAKPGGAPANLAAGVARLGLRATMISKVGDEAFGRASTASLASAGVSVEAVRLTRGHNTPVAVVSQTSTGEADYIFYRENSADSNLTVDDVALDIVSASRILHVGTLLLATPVSAAAQRHAIGHARAQGVALSTDVNLRPSFWRDHGAMRDAGLEMIALASIAKVSTEELVMLTGSAEMDDAVRALWHPGLLALAVTKGSDGAHLFTSNEAVSVPGFPVETVDTVGCGDAFMASLLTSLLKVDMKPPRGDALRAVAVRACAAGAIVATRSGALESMPDNEELERFLAGHR